MYLTTDSKSFGFRVVRDPLPSVGAKFHTFQLVVNSKLIGTEETSIIYSAVEAFNNLKEVEAPKLDPRVDSPELIIDRILQDDQLHSMAIHSVVESLDPYLVAAFIQNNEVIIITARFEGSNKSLADFQSVVVSKDEYLFLARCLAFAERCD